MFYTQESHKKVLGSQVQHARIQEFSSGGSRSVWLKSTDNVFFFLVLSLFNRGQMVNFKEIYHFSRFQRESKIF